jgi:hypothetical protein
VTPLKCYAITKQLSVIRLSGGKPNQGNKRP